MICSHWLPFSTSSKMIVSRFPCLSFLLLLNPPPHSSSHPPSLFVPTAFARESMFSFAIYIYMFIYLAHLFLLHCIHVRPEGRRITSELSTTFIAFVRTICSKTAARRGRWWRSMRFIDEKQGRRILVHLVCSDTCIH